MKLIGLAGTNGAGKDTVAQLLASKHNFLFVSISDLLRDEAEKRGLSAERKHLRQISAEWRREYGLGVLIDRAVELFQASGQKYDGLVISSIRNPGEIDRIHEFGGELLWIDADVAVRFERIASRNRADDPQTLEEFEAQQKAEMQHSGDEATLSLQGVNERADRIFINNHTDLEALNEAITEELEHSGR